MFEHIDTGDEQAPVPADLTQFDAGSASSRRPRRTVAGATAAALLLLGGGASGFLWVSSGPGAGDAFAGAPGGVVSTPPISTPSDAGSAPVAFAVGGRDVFAPTVAPTPTNASAVATPVSGTAISGSAVVTGAPPTSRAGSTTASTDVPSTVPTAGTGSSSSATSTSSSVPVPTSPTTTPATVPPVTAPQLSFVTGTEGYGLFRVGAATVGVRTGDLIGALRVRYHGLVVPSATGTGEVVPVQAVLTLADDARTGWVVTSDPTGAALLPGAVVGDPRGHLRVTAVATNRFAVSLDGSAAAVHSPGEAIGGTGLTLQGAGYGGGTLPAAGVCFTDGAGTTYFGSLGEGPSDGVSF